MCKDKTILVTGGAGFIGGAFIDLLLSEGYGDRVVCLDKLTYAAQPDRIKTHELNKRYTFVKGDIVDGWIVNKVLKKYEPACIVNFAAESHVDNSLVDDSAFYKTNVDGVETLIKGAIKYGVRHFVQVSTDEVYGQNLDGKPFCEDSPYAPRNPYAMTKVKAEEIVKTYVKQGKIEALITRGCNTFGPWQHGEKLISKTVLKAIKNESIPIYGSGLQKREWIYSSEHARAILFLIENNHFGGVFNIGSGYETTNIDIVRQILDILQKPHNLMTHVEDRKNHDFQYGVSRLKLTQAGFKVKHNMPADLLETVDFYKNRIVDMTGSSPFA